MKIDKSKEWSIDELLSSLIGFAADTNPHERAEIWASDIGKPFIDRYLAMKGQVYSNPIDGKTMMTFFLGRQVETGLIEMLNSCNLRFEAQDRITIQVPDCLPVVGRPDLILEVKKWEDVLESIDENIKNLIKDNLEDVDVQITKKEVLKQIVGKWKERYPNGLEKTPFEIKSINTNAFNYLSKSKDGFKNAHPHYQLQLYTYMIYYNLDAGRLVYVSKNDGKMVEVIVRRTPEMDKIWYDDVKKMSDYFNSNTLPPPEPFIVDGKENWKVGYSRYKDYLYKNYKFNQGLL
jgi:hypothetical protein